MERWLVVDVKDVVVRATHKCGATVSAPAAQWAPALRCPGCGVGWPAATRPVTAGPVLSDFIALRDQSETEGFLVQLEVPLGPGV